MVTRPHAANESVDVILLLRFLSRGVSWRCLFFAVAPLRHRPPASRLPPRRPPVAGTTPLIPLPANLAFVAMDASGKSLLYVRPLDSLHPRALAGTDGAILPFWSPDSLSLGFFAGGNLKKIEISGGQPTTLAKAPNSRGGAWSREGVIIFSPTPPAPLHRVPAAGGEAIPINEVDMAKGVSPRWVPNFLPDGRHYLYLASIQGVQRRLCVGSLDSNEAKCLLPVYSNAVYAPPGYLIFRREATLMAQRFDADKLALTGDPFPIGEDVGFDATSYQGFFSVSDNGVLVYHSGAAGKTQFTWFDRTAKSLAESASPLTRETCSFLPTAPACCPPGYFRTAQLTSAYGVLAGGTSSRFTFSPID